jgi:hypothetical protein
MRLRRIALLVLIYVALDFGNPLMPGAVHLVEGSLETVAGCHARTAQEPAPVVTAVPRCSFMVAPRREPIASTDRVVAAAAAAPPLFRVPLEPRSARASSSDDD